MDRRFRQNRPYRIRRRGGPLIGIIWFFGLAYLFSSHSVWPGILVLIGITIIASAVLRGDEAPLPPAPAVPPEPFRGAPPQPRPAAPVDAPTPFASSSDASAQPRPVERYDLPDRCPNCGGPTGASAPHGGTTDPTVCHYCGSRLVK